MNHFIAEVRNVMDPWESGRIQIRIYGIHDDEQNIKDEDLKWAFVSMPVTSASTERIGTSPTGLIVGSRVIGYYLDDAEQIPVVTGSFHRGGKQKTQDDNTLGKDDIDSDYNDIPIGALGSNSTANTNTQANNSNNSQSLNSNNAVDSSSRKYNKTDYVKKTDGQDSLKNSRKKNAPKTADLPTIGSTDKSQSGSILDLILKNDQNNEAGGLGPQSPQLFKQLISMNQISSMSGLAGMAGGSFGGMLSGLASMSGMGGIGNIIGQLSGILGGMVGGGGSSGGGSSIGNFGGTGSSGSTTGGTSTTNGTPSPLYEILSTSSYNDSDFVIQLYEITFGRNPDKAGYIFWTDQLARGATRIAVAESFFVSEEYNKEFPDDKSFVDSLYYNILNRQPDPAGEEYWIGQLSGSKNIPDVTKLTLAQSTSNKVQAQYFLKVAYKIILERDPDTAGYNFWINSKTSKNDIIIALFTSPEYLSKYSDPTAWTNKLYEKLLGREPDPAGLKYCLDQINSGPTSTSIKKTLVQDGLNSEEFKNLSIQPFATTIDNSSGGSGRAQIVAEFLNSKEFSNDFYKYQFDASTTALVASDLLNQLKGFTTPSSQIGGMTLQQREVLYSALLTLLNNTYVPVAEKFNLGQITNSSTIHNVDFIARLYTLVLGREYDVAGLDYWLTQLNNGMPKITIITNFFVSDEYLKKYSDPTKYVTSLYEKILGREPDIQGLVYWSDLIVTKTLQPWQVVYSFLTGSEFQNINLRNTNFVNLNATILADIISPSVNNTDFIIRLYEILLKKEPDADGLRYWVKQLENGTNRIDVIVSFCISKEYSDIYYSNLDFVTSLYVNILNRPPVTTASNSDFITRTYGILYNRNPNSDELSYWLTKLDSGLSKYDFLTNFITDSNMAFNNPTKYASNLTKETSSLNNSDFINKVYQNLYERAPTKSEINLSTSQLTAGLSRETYITNLLNDIIHSNTFNVNNYSLDPKSVLFRLTVSFNEWDYWEDLLSNQTLSREQVVRAFLNSKEFQDLEKASGNIVIDDTKISGLITNPPLVVQLMSQTTKVDATNLVVGQLMTSVVNNTDFVVRLYEILLGREYDLPGLQYILYQMNNGFTKAEVLLEFLISAEYTKDYPDNTSFVTSLYINLLNRKPATIELQTWLDYLQKTQYVTRADIARSFINSQEFIALELDPTLVKIASISTGSYTQTVTINDVAVEITVNIVNGVPTVPDSSSIPDGYVQVFSFTPTDPYPGLIRWEGPNGQILYSLRPAYLPYSATPTEDAINVAITLLMNDLVAEVNNNNLTLEVLLYLLDETFNNVQSKATQNVLGNNIDAPAYDPNTGKSGGANQALQSILGILGSLIGMAQSMHLPESVLSQGGIQQLIQDRSKDQAMLKMKKKIAQQAVSQKNEMQNMNLSQFMSFGNMASNFGGKGGSNGSSQNQPNYNNGGSGGGGTGSNSGATVNNVVNYTTVIGGNTINVTSINGRSVINIKDLPNGYYPVDVSSDPNFIKWMLLYNSGIVDQQIPFYTLKTKTAIIKAAQYLPASVINTLVPVNGDVLTTNIGGAYHVGFYPII